MIQLSFPLNCTCLESSHFAPSAWDIVGIQEILNEELNERRKEQAPEEKEGAGKVSKFFKNNKK